MIANDILAYKTRHIVGAHILQLLLRSCRINLFPCYTFGKLNDWPIRIHVNERAGCMQRMSIVVTNVLSGPS